MKQYIQKYIDDFKKADLTTFYIEGFLGGANSFFPIEADYKIGIDLNKYLIDLLKQIKMGVPIYLPNFENYTREMMYEDYRWLKQVVRENRGSVPLSLVAIYFLVYTYRASWGAGLTTFGKDDKKSRMENQIKRLNEHIEDFKFNEALIYGDYTMDLLDDILYISGTYLGRIGVVYYLDPPYPSSFQNQYINQFEYDDKFYNFIKKLLDTYPNIIILLSGWESPPKCITELIYSKEIAFTSSHVKQVNRKNDNLYRILGVKDE